MIMEFGKETYTLAPYGASYLTLISFDFKREIPQLTFFSLEGGFVFLSCLDR